MWNSNSVEDELCRNSLDYGLGVNSDRSIPDAKSGLKPVARRILYDAYVTNASSGKPHVKSARIVGDTMGRFHPHGDSSIYGAMVRLSQDWVMRYPLIDVHGNNGNILGDGPASSRYTEARLTKLSEDGMLRNIKKNVVDSIPNYDETETEPITLPAIFPNLLCNPNEGIGWALGSSWAPHNLREVASVINKVLDGEEPTFLAPDFPTGGLIINKDDIPNIVKTGKGSVKVRGKYKIEGQNIVFYELPYETRLESLMEEIGKLSDEEKINHIVSVRNETGKKGLRLVIEVEKGIDPESLVAILFAKTNLQSNFSYNQVALINKTPTELNLLDAINVYINHNLDCIQRETKYDLNKAENRFHIVEGLLIALEDINNVIDLIKKSESVNMAQQNLINKYFLSEIQAKAILDMKLSRLAKLEKVELENEKQELINTISDLKDILATKSRQENILKSRLSEIVQKYGDDRRTEVTQLEIGPKEKEEIKYVEPEQCVVVITEAGYIKRIPNATFKVAKPNSSGVKTQSDIVTDVIRTNTVDNLLVFTNKEKMYKLLVNKIPVGTNKDNGVSIKTLIEMAPDERVSTIYSMYRDTEAKYILFTTKQGLIKKCAITDFAATNKRTGIAATKTNEGDELVDVSVLTDEEILLLTAGGQVIRIKTDEISPSSRTAKGVKGITLKNNDYVVAALPIRHETDSLAVFSANGLGKKVPLSEFNVQGRAGKGIQCYRITPSSGLVAAAALVEDSDNVLVVGVKSSLYISAEDIPTASRTAIGNKILKSDTLISVSKA